MRARFRREATVTADIDSEHIAEYTSGKLPIRPPSVDPGLPTLGTGEYEWRGFLSPREHPQEVDPAEPIHQVLNPASFASRAFSNCVSIGIASVVSAMTRRSAWFMRW